MYIPKKQKYSITQKHRSYIFKNINNILLFGTIASRPINISYLTNKHLHRLIIYIKRLNKKKKYNFKRVWLPYFPNVPIFKKSKNARMGKGKGSKINWKVILTPNISVLESKNIRIGRFIKYTRILLTRLPGKFTTVSILRTYYWNLI